MEWTWNDAQETAFLKIKKQLTEAPVLAHYSADKKTVVSADASCYGLGAVLLQKQKEGNLKPVFYASRSMTDTERRYGQVEREALAVTSSDLGMRKIRRLHHRADSSHLRD